MPLLTCLQDSSEKVRGKRQKVEGGWEGVSVYLWLQGKTTRRRQGKGKEWNLRKDQNTQKMMRGKRKVEVEVD